MKSHLYVGGRSQHYRGVSSSYVNLYFFSRLILKFSTATIKYQFLSFFLAALHSMWGSRLPNQGSNLCPLLGKDSPNHRTARHFPQNISIFLNGSIQIDTNVYIFKKWRNVGREMGGRFKREGIYVYLWLIHVEI